MDLLMTAAEQDFIDALDWRTKEKGPIRLWLRDDDAVDPSDKLTSFLDLADHHAIPALLAVIPEQTGEALQTELVARGSGLVRVAVHGWSHQNHATPPAKKQELGLHRPAETVFAELEAGFSKLECLYKEQFIAMLVPPWNRINPALVDPLATIGYRALSTFHDRKSDWKASHALPFHDTHVDIINWKAGSIGRPSDELFDEMTGLIRTGHGGHPIGILTHHLVHDDQAARFLTRLFELTTRHKACHWIDPADLIA